MAVRDAARGVGEVRTTAGRQPTNVPIEKAGSGTGERPKT